MNKNLIESSIIRLRQLSGELLEHAKYLYAELQFWGSRLDSADCLPKEMKSLASRQYDNVFEEIRSINIELSSFMISLSSVNDIDTGTLQTFIERKKGILSKLRVCTTLYASIVTVLNWQSPSIKSSKNSRVGIERFPVIAEYGDYKRDRSNDTIYCEQILQRNLLVTKNVTPKPVLSLNNSGMAAFTAIIYFLIGEDIIKDKIFAPSDIYVENLLLLKKFFKDKFETFDFNNTELIVNKILQEEPDAIFLDPISNSASMALFDVSTIIRKIVEVYKKEIYFIIDVTCNIGYENLLDNLCIPHNIKVILHGTLLKAPQLGMERVNAGFVLSFGLDKFVSKIPDYRTLSGTTIQDFGCYLLPITTRRRLRTRLKIIERNTIELAKFLIKIDPKNKVFVQIVYPGLKLHKDFEMVKKIKFAGPFFNIKFHPKYNNDKFFDLFTNSVIECAKKYNCDIVHGASYGFNALSLYYSVGWDNYEKHYLRLSVGTETPYEMEEIKKVFSEVLADFREKYIAG